MSLRKKLILNKSSDRTVSRFMPAINYAVERSPRDEMLTFDEYAEYDQYRLNLRISVAFNSRLKDYDQSLHKAERLLLREVYGDFEAILLGALSAAMSGDQEETVRLINEAIAEANS